MYPIDIDNHVKAISNTVTPMSYSSLDINFNRSKQNSTFVTNALKCHFPNAATIPDGNISTIYPLTYVVRYLDRLDLSK